MNDFIFNDFRREYRDQNNLVPLTIVVGDAQGNIADPDVPGYVLVRYSQSGFLSMPFSVGAPTSKMDLRPGQAVELELDRFGNQRISGYDNQAALSQGDTPLANVLDTSKTRQQDLATLLPLPSQPASTIITVKGWQPIVDGIGYNFTGGSLDLGVSGANVIPGAGDQAWIMIALDSDYATLVAYSSTVVTLFDIIDYDDSRQECLDQLNAGATPIWMLLLSDDQSATEQADFDAGEDQRQTVNNAESSGTGSVTAVSWVTNDGVSASIANPTTAPAITPSLGDITPTSVAVDGIGGAGFFEALNQSASPSTPTTAWRMFSDASNRIAIKFANGFKWILAGLPSADRTITFQDSSGTVAYLTDIPAAGINQLTGDVTAGPGSGSVAATLATVNGNVGSFTLASITANAKGLITAISNGVVNLATQVSGALGIANGGTGQTTQTAAYDALSPNTTKGDMTVYNGTDNVADSVGSDGQIRKADSSQANGVHWVEDLGRTYANLCINSDFRFWQRRSGDPTVDTAYANKAYGADQWYVLSQTASVNYHQGGSGDTRTIYCGKFTQNQASAQRFGAAQIIESGIAYPLRGRSVRFQARIRCSSSQAIRIAVLEWTGATDVPAMDVVNSWTNGTFTAGQFFKSTTQAVVGTTNITPSANVWTDISITGSVTTSCNNLILFIWTEGTAAQNVTLEISAGWFGESTDTAFWMPVAPSVDFSRCLRFLKVFFVVNGSNQKILHGHSVSTTHSQFIYQAPAPMINIPTLVATASDWDIFGTGAAALTALSITADSTNDSITLDGTHGATTANAAFFLRSDGAANHALILTSELGV